VRRKSQSDFLACYGKMQSIFPNILGKVFDFSVKS
jgi:hypothetical protein